MTDRDRNIEMALFAAIQVRNNAVRLQERLRQEADLATGENQQTITDLANVVAIEIDNADMIIDIIEQYQEQYGNN